MTPLQRSADETTFDTPPVPEGFYVHDASSANWVVRKIAEARRYAKNVEAWAAAELRRAEAEEQFFCDRYGVQLEQWARAQMSAANGHRKSVRLPAGFVGYRTMPQRLIIQDADRLLAWCQENLPQVFVVTKRIIKPILLNHLKTSGELPAGVEWGGGEQKFYIK